MKPYQNLNGTSNIVAFQAYGDGIKIQFDDGSIYLYLYEVLGAETVTQMKTLASKGYGLGTFVASIGRELGQKLY